MKRTEKGIVRWRYWQTNPGYCIESPEGHGWYPANQLWGFLKDHKDREVEVTIEANEVEPVSLRDRVAKIFDDLINFRGAGHDSIPRMLYWAKEGVLAEIDKEGQTK